jgi:hypothetical protein
VPEPAPPAAEQCTAAVDHEDAIGGTLFCFLRKNHDGGHWDRTDNLTWQVGTRPGAPEAVPAPRFPIHARYAYPDNGWEGDREAAAEALTLGAVYSIQELKVGHSTSYFTFREVEGRFNTVLFEPVTDDGDG